MRAFLDCIPCIAQQALRTARLATADEGMQGQALRAVLQALSETDLGLTPPELSRIALQAVHRLTGCADPYAAIREESNREALELYAELEELVERGTDRLLAASKLAIAGNIIDFGAVGDQFDVQATVQRVMGMDFAVDDYQAFAAQARSAKRLMYLMDNAGEIVFDRLLLQEMQVPETTIVVRSEPFLNDATLEDARRVGMDKIGTVIAAPLGGEPPPEFRRAWSEVELIVAKGQANYEAYSELEGPLFFLLLAKCDSLAGAIGVRKGDMVLQAAERRRPR